MPIQAASVVRRLEAEARKGSTHASRELRAWMERLEDDVPVTTSELDVRTRQRLLTRLLAELRDSEDESHMAADAALQASDDEPQPS